MRAEDSALIDLATAPDFQLGKLRVRPSLREVIVGDASEILEPRVMQVLVCLARRHGEVVSRDQLTEECWAGRIVGEDAIQRCIARVRRLAEAHGDFAVETIPRVGYRLLATGTAVSAAPVAPPVASEPIRNDSPAVAVPASGMADDSRRRSRRVWLGAAMGAVAIGALAFGLVRFVGFEPSQPRIESLAVLPLENLSSDPEQEYFSDGMTDALISQLAGIGSLRIISRQSSMRYKRSTLTLPEIARELGVEGVVEGTVLRTAERVRISIQLLHAPNDRHLWSAQYERPLDDILTLQSEIARAVAAQVQATLTTAETARFARADPINPDAYDLYLRGRYFWAQRTEEGLLLSLDYFRRALDIEPDFARAHAGIAEAYGPLGYNGFLAPEEVRPKMRAAAERALELDPDLVEGMTALGACAAFHEWRWEEGERHFRRALEVSSNYSTAHGWYGLLLENTGRQPENLRARERAFELDPLWVGTGHGLGQALYFNGRAEEGVTVLRRTLELDPKNQVGLAHLGRIYAFMGRIEDAIAAFERSGDEGGLGHAYAVAGQRDKALAVLQRLEQRARERYASPYSMALVHVGLGSTAAALEALERGVAIGDTAMSGIKVDPRMTPLANEPRYHAVLAKMGLR